MTDASQPKKKANKWLWPLLAALALVAILAYAFNRGADDGNLSEKMASDPVSRLDANGTERGEPAPPQPSAAALVPDNENGNASVITEADAARNATSAGVNNDGVAGGPAGQGTPAAGAAGAAPTQ